MKKITINDVSVQANTAQRGSRFIYIGGVCWAAARARHLGPRGMAHDLTYPGGSSIKDNRQHGVQKEFNVSVSSKRQRQRNGDVDDQDTAIAKLIVDLFNRGKIESPSDRERRIADKNRQIVEQHEKETRHRTWTRDGLISLARIPGISDKEVFALKYAFKDIFHTDMP